MSLGLEAPDALEREEAERSLGSSVEPPVALDVALEAERGDPGGRHRALRDPAGRHADLGDARVVAHDPTPHAHAAARLIIRFTIASSTTSPR